MKKRLNSHKHILHVLGTARPKMRKAILNHADRSLVQTLTECVYNVLNGNIPLSACAVKKLSRFRSKLRSAVSPKHKKWQGRKNYFVQHGGFLSVLLPLIGSAISGLVSSLMSK